MEVPGGKGGKSRWRKGKSKWEREIQVRGRKFQLGKQENPGGGGEIELRGWKFPVGREIPGGNGLTWYTWSVVLFFFTLTVTVVTSGSATRSSTSETPL